QVERAILWGFDVTHLDSHMGTLQLRPEFFDVYLELAVDFALPLRLSGASTERTIGFPFRTLAADEGVVFPDHFVYVSGVGSRRALERAIFDLRPGVTELYAHPAADTPELRAVAADWAARVDDLPDGIHGVSLITPPPVTAGLLPAIAARGIRRVWLQPGAESGEALQLAQELGLDCIAGGPCLLIEIDQGDPAG
ncbi:MAG: ChbG/HpnK family deacetylase, partial [Planctomycetota bacterium]